MKSVSRGIAVTISYFDLFERNCSPPLGSGVGEGTMVEVQVGEQTFEEEVVLQAVPAPATLALLAPIALLVRSRRRSSRPA